MSLYYTRTLKPVSILYSYSYHYHIILGLFYHCIIILLLLKILSSDHSGADKDRKEITTLHHVPGLLLYVGRLRLT